MHIKLYPHHEPILNQSFRLVEIFFYKGMMFNQVLPLFWTMEFVILKNPLYLSIVILKNTLLSNLTINIHNNTQEKSQIVNISPGPNSKSWTELLAGKSTNHWVNKATQPDSFEKVKQAMIKVVNND